MAMEFVDASLKKRKTISMSELPNSKLYMLYIHIYIFI